MSNTTITVDNVRVNVSDRKHLALVNKHLGTIKRGGALFGFHHPKTNKSFARAQFVLPTNYGGWTVKRLASLDNEKVETKFAGYPMGVATDHLGVTPEDQPKAIDIAVSLPNVPTKDEWPLCEATTKQGKQCRKTANPGSKFCGTHRDFVLDYPTPPKLHSRPKTEAVYINKLNLPVTTIGKPIPFDAEEFIPSEEDARFAANLF